MPTARFDAVVFDLDGTLCDSEPFIAAAAAEALRRRYGITVPREDFAPFVGAGDDRFIAGGAAAHGVTADLAVDKPLTYQVYLELIPGALQPIAGAAAFVGRLRAAGLRVALATGSDRPKLLGNLAAIGLSESGYHPPIPRAYVLPGENGIATLGMMIDTLTAGGYASAHDALIARKLAVVLCGGAGGHTHEVTEQEVLDLECEAFISLAGEAKSQERMQSMLMNNRPLRN